MSQDSILELLSVTSNAVKALDKTGSSRSVASKAGSSRRTTPREQDASGQPLSAFDTRNSRRSSGDSGVGKTATHSATVRTGTGRDGDAGEDSDHSTTASEVLIHSTHAPAKHGAFSLNSSSTSQSSRLREMDNFNVSDAKKVKVSKKHLREIVSPRDSADFSQTKQSSTEANLDRNFSNHGIADLNTNNNRSARRGEYEIGKENKGKIINGMTGKIIPGVPEKLSGFTASFSAPKSTKSFPSKLPESSSIVYTVERHDSQKPAAVTGASEFQRKNNQREAAADTRPYPGSYKAVKHMDNSKPTVIKTFPVVPEDQQEDWDEGETESVTSSQPEIFTVPERVVNISSQALLPSEGDDSASLNSAVDKVSEANRPQAFPRAKPPGPGLRQGALTQGGMPRGKKEDEVQISKFCLTDKQRELRNALAKRGDQSKPVKRVVHAKMVDSQASSVSEDGNKNNNMDTEGSGNTGGTVTNVDSITAAVAASAAAAVTQPFLKLQQELENKMQTLLAEMDRVQKGVPGGTAGSSVDTGTDTRRLEHLEQQMKELTERRLQHLETLQHQQMEMQAHLLSMSRGMSQQHQLGHVQYFPTSTLYPSGSASAHSLGTSRQQPYSRPFIEHQLAQGRMQGGHSGIGMQGEGGTGQKGSVLDTPTPREKPPRPMEYRGSKGGGGLLQEILAAEPSPQLNTTFNLPHGHTPPTRLPRSRRGDGGSPVEKARKLVQDLSNLENETADSIWYEQKKTSRSRMPTDEPAPLESYLKRVRDPNSTPYSKLLKSKRRHSSSPSKSSTTTTTSRDAPVSDKFDDAHSVLRSVVAERQMFENNLDLLLRSRQDVDVCAMLGMTGADSSGMSRIKKMVEKRIASIQNEVKREVEWDMQHGGVKGTQASTSDNRKATRGLAGKPSVGFGSVAPRMSKIDSGLRKANPLSETISMPSRGKKIVKPMAFPKKSKIPYNDEEAMTRIYGKAEYQKGRTTMRDPYLHFQNQAKQRTLRIPSPKRAESFIDVKSSKTQTSAGAGGQMYEAGGGSVGGGGPRQFYFTPSTGYVPLTSSTPAPVPGQLVPMAVPLGKPRMDHGLATGGPQTLPFSIPPRSSTPVRPVVTAATNVAMVAMTAGDEEEAEREPELGKQVLPAVDIDSISPASTPRGSDIHINQPDTSRNAGYTQTFHYQDSEEDEEGDRTLTEDMSEEDQQGTGISLPGYHQPTPARESPLTASPDRASRNVRFQGSKPQLREEGHVPWEERCDELAEDLRTRDILQNRAKYWLEQELMARMLLHMYPSMAAQTEAQPDQADADKSDSIPDDESLIIGDTIGREGLQLFVDAGQPIDNRLVNALVKEVIAEKVSGMLRRQTDEETASAARAAGSRPGARSGGLGAAAGMENEPDFVPPTRQADRVPTPQPTPRTSPVPGFVSRRAAPATPPLTPPLSPKAPFRHEGDVSEGTLPVRAAAPLQVQPLQPVVVESDTEVSASVDISEELRVLDEKLQPPQMFAQYLSQSQHDVVTPQATPPPSPQPQERPSERTPAPSPLPPRHAVEPPPPASLALLSPKKEVVGQAKSPQPWGNPDSPVPELNPDYEEPDEGLQHTQPKPLLMSIGVGPGPEVEKRRSPSPQRQHTTSSDHSELDSVSSPSSQSDTNNDNISEGQWLVSRSEGQVAAFPLDEGVQRMAVEAVRKIDISTASTLRDTDDIELDDTDVSRSEGEFRHRGDGNPETDPVLALMLQMQRQPGGFRQYDLPADRVQHVLSTTGKSLGEVTVNGGHGVMTRKSMGEMSDGQVLPGNRVTVVTPKGAEARAVEQYSSSYVEESMAYQTSPQRNGSRRVDNGRSSPSEHRAPNKHRNKSPSLSSRARQQQYQPVSSGLPPAVSQSRRPLKSALVRNSSEEYRQSRDSDPDSERRGPPTEYGTRTLTPDQLNTDALLQSVSYVNVSRSMGSSGRQGTKKSVEFDLSGTYEVSRRDSWRGSEDYTAGSSERLSSSGRSLGLRYSFEESGSDREPPSDAHLRMSVTIPTSDAGDLESDVSEIEISESAGK